MTSPRGLTFLRSPPWQLLQVLEIPDDVAARGGVLWWNALMLKHVIRPNAWLQDQIRAAKHLVGMHHPIIGMHVRQGDACSDWSRPAACPPLSAYVEAAKEMRNLYGVSRIFLATDSSEWNCGVV
jgi:hypothetical protein